MTSKLDSDNGEVFVASDTDSVTFEYENQSDVGDEQDDIDELNDDNDDDDDDDDDEDGDDDDDDDGCNAKDGESCGDDDRSRAENSDDEMDVESTSSDGNSQGKDSRGLDMEDILDLIQADKVTSVQVFRHSTDKMKDYITHDPKQRRALSKLLANPGPDIKQWKVWDHHKKEHSVQMAEDKQKENDESNEAKSKMVESMKRKVAAKKGKSANTKSAASAKNASTGKYTLSDFFINYLV